MISTTSPAASAVSAGVHDCAHCTELSGDALRTHALEVSTAGQQHVVDLAVDPSVAYVPVDGPAGFGKTHTAVSIASQVIGQDRRVLIATPTRALVRDTVLDLCARLGDPQEVGVLGSADAVREVRAAVDAAGYGSIASRAEDAAVNVSTVAKLGWVDAPDGPLFDVAILDEATMQDAGAAVAMFRLGRRVVAMYDSRQQRAFLRTGSLLLGHHVRGTVPASVALPGYARELRPGFQVAQPVQMRTTFRFGQSIADVVSPGYPQRVLSAAATHGAVLAADMDAPAGMSQVVACALDRGVAVAEFARPQPGERATVDGLAAVVAADAAVVAALGVARADGSVVGPRNVLVVAARREQARAVAQAVRERHVPVRVASADDLGATSITASQGLTVDMVVVVHPLTGMAPAGADPFHLELGRMLVALTRARLGAIVVAPEDVGAGLPDREPGRLPDPWHGHDRTSDGWVFHRSVLDGVRRVPVEPAGR